MCGRYTLTASDHAALRERFPIGEEVQWQPRYNTAPGDEVLAVTTDRDGRPRGELLRWGLVPAWAKQPELAMKLINARVETVAERAAFRASVARFRCLIIADGFYEWLAIEGRRKQPFHISRADRTPFAFAGLWSIWRGAGSTIRSCAILTTAANSAIAPLHDRMPVILEREVEDAWLSGALTHDERISAGVLLDGLPASMTALRPVGPTVNDARYDGPDCLNPADARAQATLF